MFCTSARWRRCSTSRRKAAASKSRCCCGLGFSMALLLSPRPSSKRPGARTVHLHLMYIGTAVDRFNDRRQPRSPGERAGFVGDQVLPDLDQRMGEAVDDGVLE